MQATINQPTFFRKDALSPIDVSFSYWLIRGIQGNFNWFKGSKKDYPSFGSHLQSIIFFPVFFLIRIFLLNYLVKEAKRIFQVRNYDEIIKDPKFFKILMGHYSSLQIIDSQSDKSILTKNIRSYIPMGARILINPIQQIDEIRSAYVASLKDSFEKLDQTPKNDFFQHLDNETLWNDRIKAYEYIA